MSRCFPFPPPGYEKKARTDEVDLIKKEQHKERKHKKEREEKEKKDSKEKREKEGRDGKHKEKKDKKEKHRDKKKDKEDKDREKDKNKNSIANEKGFPAEGANVARPHQKEIKHKDKQSNLFEKKSTKQYDGHNGEKARENNHLVDENKDSIFLQELGRRIKDEDGRARNQLVQKFTITDHRTDEGAVKLVGKGGSICLDGEERLKDKIIDRRKTDGPGIQSVSQPSGNATVQNHTGNFHPRVDGMPGSLEKNIHQPMEATVEGKEKSKEKKDDKQGDKRKDKEKEKKGHGKDKDRDKEKKKEEKQKDPTEHKNVELNKLKENKKGGLIGPNSLTQVPRDSHENAVAGENSKKRKDMESNGILHAKDSLPYKLPRISSSSHPFPENGRISEPCQISSSYTSDRPGVSTDLKVDNKQRKINGIIEAGPSAVTSKRIVTATVPAEPTAKLPHPDSKYLSLVYSVPKVEEWSGFDDQDWLFGSSCPPERKHVVESSKAGETPQVWAEALHIEQADVCALPYVIPY